MEIGAVMHVVLGASGGAGRAVARELSARGARVRAVSRSGRGEPLPGVEHVRGDATDEESLRTVCRDAAVVYHCVNVPYPDWTKHLLPIAEAIVGAAGAAGARLVVMDNLYMYGPPDGPMTETTPRAARGRKGRLRARLEDYFLRAHRTGVVRVAIGRASDFYGVVANSAPNMFVITPAIQGKAASWVANLDAPHTMNYLPDVARALITLGARDEALGEIWHLPAAEPLTGRQFIEMVFGEIGRAPRMRVIGRPLMLLAGLFSPMIRESAEVFYQFERPFVMDASKFERALGKQVTPHHEAIQEILRGVSEGNPRHPKRSFASGS
jgi:nucleoside-diphosphate-sugar epimerase